MGYFTTGNKLGVAMKRNLEVVSLKQMSKTRMKGGNIVIEVDKEDHTKVVDAQV